jgi:predicted ATPase
MPTSAQQRDRRNTIRFIDRDKELSILEKALDMAMKGKGNMVLVRGEAGIGKSRIVSEVAENAGSRGFHTLKGSCLEYRKVPYQPFREMLLEHFRADPTKPYSENLERIGAAIDTELPNLGDNKNLLIEFFYPLDEPLGGYRIPQGDLASAIESLRKKGFRIIYLGDPKRLKEWMVPTEGLENVIFGEGPGSINPRRLEKLANFINSTFKSFNHSALIMGDLDSILAHHNVSRICKFIQISDSLCAQNGGVMVYVDPSRNQELLKDERLLSEYLSKDKRPTARMEDDERPSLSIIDLLSRLFKDLSQKRPQLTIVEDLQWGDKPTFNLLQYLARNIQNQRHLIIGTFRDESLTAEGSAGSIPLIEALQRFTREHLYEEIHLGPISEPSVAELVSDLIGAQAPRALVEEVIRESEGNPLFIIELMKLKLDQSGNVNAELDRAPQSAATLVRRRIETLDPIQRKVLEQASVLDKHASLDLLSRTLKTDPEELLDPVDHLISLKFFTEKDEHISFEHSKVRELIYDLIDPNVRTGMHLAAARSLESSLQSDSPDYLGSLSYHYLRGGESRKALEFLLQMTEGHRGLLAAESVLDQMISGAESMEAENGISVAAEFKARVYMRIGDLLESMEDLGESSNYYQRVVNLCEAEGLHHYISQAYRRLGDLMLRFYKWDHTVDYYLRALHLAKRYDDPVEIAQVFRGLGRMYYLKGDYSRAIECYLKYMEVPSHAKGRPYFIGMLGLGDVYKELGDFNQALVYYKLAIRTSEEYDLRSDISLAYIRMARVLLRFGELSDSERMGEWAYSLAKDLNRPHLTREVTIQFADTMMELGILKRADESLREYPVEGGSIGDQLLTACYRRACGTLYSKLRDHERAAQNMDESVSVLESIQVPHQLGRAYLEQGLAKFQAMDIMGAIGVIQKANGIFKSLRSVYYQNRTASKLRELKFINEGMN